MLAATEARLKLLCEQAAKGVRRTRQQAATKTACMVTIEDMNGVRHTVDVTATSLYDQIISIICIYETQSSEGAIRCLVLE